MLYNSCFRFFAGKLRSKWEGPFTIQEVYRSSAIRLEDGAKTRTMNGQRLKNYILGDHHEEELDYIESISIEDFQRYEDSHFGNPTQ